MLSLSAMLNSMLSEVIKNIIGTAEIELPVRIAISIMIFLFLYLLLNTLRMLCGKILKKLVLKTKATIYEDLITAMRYPTRIIIILISSYFALSFLFGTQKIFDKSLEEIFSILLVAWGAFTTSMLVSAGIGWYSEETYLKTRFGKEAFPLVKRLINIFIYGLALIIILDLLGIEITPLLTGLGIAGLAVALALQESLSNFFAGMYIVADKPVRVGDFIQLQEGMLGYVEDIGWRSTKIRTIENNIVVVPNSKLAQSIVINYSLPNEEINDTLNIGVSYDSDVDKVERILKEAAKYIIEREPGCIKGFEPIVRFTDFGASALNFTLIYRIRRYKDRFEVATNMRKEILKRFGEEGITIPFPTTRTIYTKK